MKIAILIHSLEAGGAERVATILANEFCRRGNSVFLVTFEDKKKDHYRVTDGVVRLDLGIAGVSKNPGEALLKNLRRIFLIRKYIRVLRPDVTIAFTTKVAVLCSIATIGLRTLLLIREAIYPPFFPLGFIWEKLRRLTYPIANRIVMQTEEGAQWIKANTRFSKVCVIPNPIILPLPKLDPSIPPTDIIQSEKKIILGVGRLDYQKGFDLLITAFKEVSKEHKDWDLVILGEGPERNNLERLVLENNLKGRVHLLGKVGNIGQWYERAEIFVLASRFEGFPNALLEAMAYGCAVVSLDCPTGPNEIISHQTNGLLVELNQAVSGIAKALGMLIKDKALRERLSENAKNVRLKYAVSNVVDQWQKLTFLR